MQSCIDRASVSHITSKNGGRLEFGHVANGPYIAYYPHAGSGEHHTFFLSNSSNGDKPSAAKFNNDGSSKITWQA